MSATVTIPPGTPSVWLAEINAPSPGAPPPLYPGLIPGAAPTGAIALAAATPALLPPILVSDRGWTGEPGDPDAANAAYLARMVEPPALVREVPIYPDAERRAVLNEAELVLVADAPGTDRLARSWLLAGAKVTILRGPRTTPLAAPYAAFARVSQHRVGAAPYGGRRARVSLRSVAADLSVPACRLFEGTGGPEGPETLRGTAKPRCYGWPKQVSPVVVDAALLIAHLHDGAIAGVAAVRDEGIPLTPAGDLPSYAALAAATVAGGTYRTCLATGHLRLGAPASALTVDLMGDVGAGGWGDGTAPRVAAQILQGAGGVPAPRAPEAAFDWPASQVALVVRDGTVADALSRLARGLIAWWGADAFGTFRGGRIAPPETLAPVLTLDARVILSAEPVEQPRAPWWRATVEYDPRETVQTLPKDGGVGEADRLYYAKPSSSITAVSLSTLGAFPLAEDGAPIPAVVRTPGSAQVIANRALALYGPERRAVAVRLDGDWTGLVEGSAVRLAWDGPGLPPAGTTFLVRSVDARGDRAEVMLWG